MNVEHICEKLGISILEKDLDNNVSGFLLFKGALPYIFIDKNQSEGRKRFTIAHELGHFMLHKDQQLHVLSNDLISIAKYRNEVSSQGVDTEEIEANRFAAELLMPEEMITRYMKEKDLSFISEEIINDMARDFQVLY